ncbi:hypothetical protein GKE82_25025 [Conexibacter sp. W3-3-2]|uniref:hypothetical protein n=1 Tax=Conexibacter sp. W3-3-2 TaxID=2675227 RepID=UPI0012B6C36C|nr:hypothetical protein [Conexibacter sp. W3-3-2]MTD47469.1 hypothetical protein [Conexibacter sp. W3-3-2]
MRFATDASPHVDTIGTPDLTAHPLSRIWTIPTPEGSFRLQLKSDIDDVRAEQRQTELLPRSPAENRTSLVLLTWATGSPRLVALERGVVLWWIDVVALATAAPVEAIRTTARRGVRSRTERQETGERRETS